MTGDIEPVVADAVARFNGVGRTANENIFNTAGFQNAVREAFGTRDFPTSDWCRDLLGKLDYVEPLPGGAHWKYKPGKGGVCPKS